MKTKELSIKQRIIAVAIYILIIIASCQISSGDWQFLTNSDNPYNILFVSGALLLVFGAYISEPYFTKPVDVITNSVAVILALIGISKPDSFFGYWVLFYSSIFLFLFSIFLVLISQFSKENIIQRLFFVFVTKIGQSKFIFSVMYLLTIYSYFKNKPIHYIFFFSFWVVFISQYVVEKIILECSNLFEYLFTTKNQKKVIGEAFGCDNPFLYSVEIDYTKHNKSKKSKGDLICLQLENNIGALGIIIDIKHLLNKEWLSVYLLANDNRYLTLNLKTNEFVNSPNSIYSKNNSVYALTLDEIIDENQRKIVEENYLYKNRNNFIGYVSAGSNINKIRFLSLLDDTNKKYSYLKEGSIIKTEIYDSEVLYQIIDGTTDEQELDKQNSYGYLTGIAHKLGNYDLARKELNVVKWLPNIFTPIFFEEYKQVTKTELSIGCLPETNLEILIKDPHSLITHNTAILGILGIGKSCLTFELIQKILSNITDVKIICIDITNQYRVELLNYLDGHILKDDLSDDAKKELKSKNLDGKPDNPTTWGNEKLYNEILDNELNCFFRDSEKRVLIINPDWHSVSKAGTKYKIEHKVDLTLPEKTRIISERLFLLSKKIWDSKEIDEQKINRGKFLIVYEEAHSLIPEFSSSSNEGDQSASNGTAKVILQGRKYGLGSLVVTQRTANISKSILNQCNTIFALRIFDDTGKQFLENYIGSDYSNTLPTLDERYAIVVGKALRLKQPVIVKLNDLNDVIINKNELN